MIGHESLDGGDIEKITSVERASIPVAHHAESKDTLRQNEIAEADWHLDYKIILTFAVGL